MMVAKNELDILLENQLLINRQIPILFFANKMDLPIAMPILEISNCLELDRITDRPWNI